MLKNDKPTNKVRNNENLKSKKVLTQNENNTNVIKTEINKRRCVILDGLYSLIDKTKFDPILETFKNNELLKEFYMKRIFEIFEVCCIY